MAALEATFHFPHLRISMYPLHVLTAPGPQEDIFGLSEENWARSGWTDRRIVHYDPKKAHMLTTFARYHPDGSEYVRYDGLCAIEYRDGFWGITARSTFTP